MAFLAQFYTMLKCDFRMFDIINILFLQVELMGKIAWKAFATELSCNIIQVQSEFLLFISYLATFCLKWLAFSVQCLVEQQSSDV